MGWRDELAADGITYLNCGDAALLDEAEDEARAQHFEDDRYDAAHPEEEHDGGLGSGDWLKERES